MLDYRDLHPFELRAHGDGVEEMDGFPIHWFGLDVAARLLAQAAAPLSAARDKSGGTERPLSSVSAATLDSLRTSLGGVAEKQETSARGAKRKRRTTPQQGHAEAREEAVVYGRRPDPQEQGRILGLQQALLVTWSSRFGSVPALVQERLEAISDIAKLDALLRMIVTLESNEEATQVVEAIGAPRARHR
jgi:hypothetical protein